MAAVDFGPVMDAVYGVEGGFSNDPRDPGGMTDLGVTAAQWARWLRVPLSAVSEALMRSLTRAETDPFYRAWYWDIVDGDAVPAGLDAMLMHMEVNAGDCAGRELQAIVGVAQDGQIGPKTLAAVATYVGYAGIDKLIDAMAAAQMAHYESLPGWAIYQHGWSNRVAAMTALAKRLAA